MDAGKVMNQSLDTIKSLINEIIMSSSNKIASSLATLLLSAVILFGCNNDVGVDPSLNTKKQNDVKLGLNIVEFSGCQYIIYLSGSYGGCAMVHAGNCNNTEHK